MNHTRRDRMRHMCRVFGVTGSTLVVHMCHEISNVVSFGRVIAACQFVAPQPPRV
jgi:hypothetical protein